MKTQINKKSLEKAIKAVKKFADKDLKGAMFLNDSLVTVNRAAGSNLAFRVNLHSGSVDGLKAGLGISTIESLIKVNSKRSDIEIEIIPESEQLRSHILKAGYIDYFPNCSKQEKLLEETNFNRLVRISFDDFVEAMNITLNTYSQKDLRPVLEGVYFQIENGMLRITSTDSYRLGDIKIGDVEYDKEFVCCIPGNVLKKFYSLLDTKSKQDIILSECFIDEKRFIKLAYNDYELIIKNSDGTYPNVDRILPKEYNFKISFNPEDLLNALEILTSSTFKSERVSVVTMNISNDKACLSADNRAIKSDITFEFPVDHKEEFRVAFNGQFLKEAVESLVKENLKTKPKQFKNDIDLSFVGSLKPIQISYPLSKGAEIIVPLRTHEY